MGVYDRQIARAKVMIAAKGQACQWQQTPSSTPDASKPWTQLNSAMTVYPVIIAFFPAASPLLKMIVGSNVASSKLRGIMGAVDFTPNISDTIVRGNDVLRLSDLDPLQINDQIILWKMEFQS